MTSIRTLYETALKTAGFAVNTAQDGEETLAKATQGGWL